MMSADTPNCSQGQNKVSERTRTILPQQVIDPTILDSVAGFINDVVPAGYYVPNEGADQIQWAHIEQIYIDHLALNGDLEGEKIVNAPLLLVLGYSTGIQVSNL